MKANAWNEHTNVVPTTKKHHNTIAANSFNTLGTLSNVNQFRRQHDLQPEHQKHQHLEHPWKERLNHQNQLRRNKWSERLVPTNRHIRTRTARRKKKNKKKTRGDFRMSPQIVNRWRHLLRCPAPTPPAWRRIGVNSHQPTTHTECKMISATAYTKPVPALVPQSGIRRSSKEHTTHHAREGNNLRQLHQLERRTSCSKMLLQKHTTEYSRHKNKPKENRWITRQQPLLETRSSSISKKKK